MTPHKITENLVVSPNEATLYDDLDSRCPLQWLHIADIRWNVDSTHYYKTPHGWLCHFVMPQYNVHGNYWIDQTKAQASSQTPATCAEDTFPLEYYFYHGSIGYYAFYEEGRGTFCAQDNTAHVTVQGLGTFDSNGSHLAEDTGSTFYRESCWYGVFGVIWTTYRGIQMRRCYISCKRYGKRCERMREGLRRKIAMVYVQENMHLAAHGAKTYHRALLLYLLIEGLMTDLFMLIAQDGFWTKIQYVSLGYNLSGVLLLAYEIVENTRCLRQKWRVVIKRLLFCYESSLLGELVSAFGLNYFLASINRSGLKESRSTAVAVSYYAWSLVGHGIFICEIIGCVIAVRVLWAIAYTWWHHSTWVIFSTVCCVDSALGRRNKMVLLSGYRLHNGHLYYTVEALKAFGLLMMEEDGAQFMVLRKLRWFAVPTDNLFVIGKVSGQSVAKCDERPCTGVTSFFHKELGGKCPKHSSSLSLWSFE